MVRMQKGKGRPRIAFRTLGRNFPSEQEIEEKQAKLCYDKEARKLHGNTEATINFPLCCSKRRARWTSAKVEECKRRERG